MTATTRREPAADPPAPPRPLYGLAASYGPQLSMVNVQRGMFPDDSAAGLEHAATRGLGSATC